MPERTNKLSVETHIFICITGGDVLGEAIGNTLGDYFMRRVGTLASISVVRCGMSDEGAKAIAKGVSVSPSLTHLDLSGMAKH